MFSFRVLEEFARIALEFQENNLCEEMQTRKTAITPIPQNVNLPIQPLPAVQPFPTSQPLSMQATVQPLPTAHSIPPQFASMSHLELSQVQQLTQIQHQLQQAFFTKQVQALSGYNSGDFVPATPQQAFMNQVQAFAHMNKATSIYDYNRSMEQMRSRQMHYQGKLVPSYITNYKPLSIIPPYEMPTKSSHGLNELASVALGKSINSTPSLKETSAEIKRKRRKKTDSDDEDYIPHYAAQRKNKKNTNRRRSRRSLQSANEQNIDDALPPFAKVTRGKRKSKKKSYAIFADDPSDHDSDGDYLPELPDYQFGVKKTYPTRSTRSTVKVSEERIDFTSINKRKLEDLAQNSRKMKRRRLTKGVDGEEFIPRPSLPNFQGLRVVQRQIYQQVGPPYHLNSMTTLSTNTPRVPTNTSNTPLDSGKWEPANVNPHAFGTMQYWDERYRLNGKDGVFEWYCTLPDILPSIRKFFPQNKSKSRILEMGCGNSPLALELQRHFGYRNICAADFSDQCIEDHAAHQQKKPPLFPIEYKAEDGLQTSFTDNFFDAIISKGYLDAVDCGSFLNSDNYQKVVKAAEEMWRVMKPGGVWAMITARGMQKRCEFISDLQEKKQYFRIVHSEKVESLYNRSDTCRLIILQKTQKIIKRRKY